MQRKYCDQILYYVRALSAQRALSEARPHSHCEAGSVPVELPCVALLALHEVMASKSASYPRDMQRSAFPMFFRRLLKPDQMDYECDSGPLMSTHCDVNF